MSRTSRPNLKPRSAAAMATASLIAGISFASGSPAQAENYEWPTTSYVDCGGQYRPTVSSRATQNVQHFQSQRGSYGWWNSSPLWTNGSTATLRDFRVNYTQSQLAKILSTGYFGNAKSWLCE